MMLCLAVCRPWKLVMSSHRQVVDDQPFSAALSLHLTPVPSLEEVESEQRPHLGFGGRGTAARHWHWHRHWVPENPFLDTPGNPVRCWCVAPGICTPAVLETDSFSEVAVDGHGGPSAL